MSTKFFVHCFAYLVGVNELIGCATLSFGLAFCLRYLQENYWNTPEILSNIQLHVIISFIGLIFVNTTGILLFRIFKGYSTNYVRHLHSTIHLLAYAVTALGMFPIITNKWPLKKKPEAYSIHAIYGLMAFGCCAIQFGSGLVLYILIYARISRILDKFSTIHSFLGIMSIMVFAQATVTGFASKVYDNKAFFKIIDSSAAREASYEEVTSEFHMIFGAVLCTVPFAWNTIFITINPYFEWQRVGSK